jgi:hypothetical protein
VEGCCEHGNEPLRSKRGEEFLDYLKDYAASHERLWSIELVS